MRIISGKYGGRHFKPPKGMDLRPTTERTREALFNILRARYHLPESIVLECFCGTGAMSLEFLSRGAAAVTSVDKDPKAVRFLSDLYRQLGESESKAVRMPAEKFLAGCRDQFDFIFLDPPYELPNQRQMIQLILEKPLLRPDGVLVLEHRTLYHFDDMPGWTDTRVYGGSSLSFFELEAE